jgi:hypothetical protein
MDCSPFCADAIFAAYRRPSARTCLSYAAIQFSVEGESEFSRHPIYNENISDNKPKKQNAARRVHLFWLLFWRNKKVKAAGLPPALSI